MGLTKCLCLGVVFVVLLCLRYSLAGYCKFPYPCTYTCSIRVRHKTDCSPFEWGWTECTVYRTRYSKCSKTCYRQNCCPGYQGTLCQTPLCYGSTTCPNGATCARPNSCYCRSGFSGSRCADTNECNTFNGGCQHNCINTHGSYICSCRSGYSLGSDGKSCYNINECASNNGGCQHYCSDSTGSYSCSCRQGYTLHWNRKSCTDINECSVGTSGCVQVCTNTAGSFSCSCLDGYEADGKSCKDIDECEKGSAGCSHLCDNTPGSYKCSCNDNYQLEADGKTCTQIILCATEQNTCDQICVERPGSLHCDCHPGYTLGADGSTCYDIDECAKMVSGCSQSCTNTVGSYQCSCYVGYVLAKNGRTCTHLDDCASYPCKNGGTCVDHVDRFTCICPRGYTGHTCDLDVNECLFINGGCQQVCTNTIGSFVCSCADADYVLKSDGFSCTREKEMTSEKDMPQRDVFERRGLARQLLPQGCHYILLTSCPDVKKIKKIEKIEVHLSSTSPWYRSRKKSDIIFSPGVIFAEVNELSLPVSLSGVTVNKSGQRFSISLGVSSLTPANGVPVGITNTDECLSMEMTPADLFDLVQGNSFLKTIFDKLSAALPDFLQLSGVNSSLLAAANMKTNFVYGMDIDDTDWCEGAPVINEHLYSVFRFETDFEISIYGNHLNIPKPSGERQFCLIIDICQKYGGTVFLRIPEGSRHLLQDYDVFKMLSKQKLALLPSGIGISIDKLFNVHKIARSLKLWNGDQFFTYPTFNHSNVWIEGDVNYNTSLFTVNAVVDVFISVPSPGQILTGVFLDEWNVLAHVGMSHAMLKFTLSNTNYAITLLDLQTTNIDVYMSIGGPQDRKWCGDGSPTNIANPPGIFFATTITINPFSNVFILGDWILKASTRLYAYFTTNVSQTLPPKSSNDVGIEIEYLVKSLNSLGNFLEDIIQSAELSIHNVSLSFVDDAKTAVKEINTTLSAKQDKLKKGDPSETHKLLSDLWGKLVKLKTAVVNFYDAIKFIASETLNTITDSIKDELAKIMDSIDKAIAKFSEQVTSAVEDYSAFGLKYSIGVKILGFDFGELDVEVSVSNDVVARCSRFEEAYKLINNTRAIIILGRYSREEKLGSFIVSKSGSGFGGAIGMASQEVVFRFHVYIRILGISTTSDLFLSRNGLHVYIEGNVWNIFLAQIDMSATRGDEWYALTFTLKGRFVANARNKRQIQRKGDSFKDSYLDGLIKLTRTVADDANKRLSHAQGGLTKAQNELTKAQIWLEHKKPDIRKANAAFDKAIENLEREKQKLEKAKGPYRRALDKLSDEQRKINNLCKIKTCKELCIPGPKCKICHKRVLGIRFPYPCCSWTSCMISVPEPKCALVNFACRVVRSLAYAALELAKAFVQVPLLAFDIAKAFVSAAQVIVDKSRVLLDIAEGAVQFAQSALELTKGILEGAKYALEGVKYAIRGAAMILEFVIEYGLKSVIDVKNCHFEVQIHTTDLPVFEVSCEVNAFRLGWTAIGMRIDFRNALQTLWRAAKATIEQIIKTFENLSDRKKRDISYTSSIKMHAFLRNLRHAENVLNDSEGIPDFIDVINQTLGMSGNVSSTYEGRKKWFEDKCKLVKPVELFLLESFGALFDIANESKSSMMLPEDVNDVTNDFDFEAIMNDMTLESADISEVYASSVYGLSRNELYDALGDAKKHFNDDPVVIEVKNANLIASKLISDEMESVGKTSVIEWWVSAMRNTSVTYFKEEECSGFEDCLFYAVTTMYDLYEDEDKLPNITNIRDLITALESGVMSLLQRNTTSVDETFKLAKDVYNTIQSLTGLNMFCSKPPRFKSTFRNATVIPGSTVRLECEADADPPASVHWFKGNLPFPASIANSLEIINITFDDHGIFKCTARNIVADITSPEITVSVVQPEELCQDYGETTFTKTDDDNCRTYIQCSKAGFAKPMCCRQGRRFDVEEGQCVAASNLDCLLQECPNYYGQECRLIGVVSQQSVYRDLDAHGSPAMHCAPGTIFTQETCGCNGVINNPGKGCTLEGTEDPTRYFDTASKKVKRCPPDHQYDTKECGCIKNNGYICRLDAVDGFPNKYQYPTAGVEMSCPANAVFDNKVCTCITSPESNGCTRETMDDHTTSINEKSCPPGHVFDEEKCRCKKRNGAECTLDAVDGFPTMYLDVPTGAVLTCPASTTFDRGHCTCLTPSINNGCLFVPVVGHPMDFLYVDGGLILTCPPGTVFSLRVCACDFLRNVS